MRDDSHRRRDFLAGLAGAAAAMAVGGPPDAQGVDAAPLRVRPREFLRTQPAAPAFMYVGSFTSEARGHGEGLSVYRRNRESGTWALIQVAEGTGGPVVSHHRSAGAVSLFGPR